MLRYQEYLASGDEICATLSFQDYYTIKHRSWPKDLDQDSLKGTGRKLKGVEHEGQVKKHASSHIEDLCIKEDQTEAYQDNDTSIVGGHSYDGSSKLAKDENATACLTYDGYGDIEEPISFPMYDANDDMDSVRRPIYDLDDDTGMIVLESNKSWKLCMEEDNEGTEVMNQNL